MIMIMMVMMMIITIIIIIIIIIRYLHREGADEQVAAGGEIRDDLGQVRHAPQVRQPQDAFIILL